MNSKKQILTRKRNKLKASATEAATLAQAERVLADQQHMVAHDMEQLAKDLKGQVAAVDAEIKDIEGQ